MLKCVNIEEMICDKVMEMMEERPFYKIKVSDLTNETKIGRSTFYLHFDSIYDVIEKIENDCIQGLLEEPSVVNQMYSPLGADRAREQILSVMNLNAKYMRAHSREFRLLLGENGDPAFSLKLAKRIRSSITGNLRRLGKNSLPEKKLNLICEFIINGMLAFHRYTLTHQDLFTDDEIAQLSMKITNQLYTLFKDKELF